MSRVRWGSDAEVYTRHCMRVNLHRYLYYILNTNVITDAQYDRYESYLRYLELATPVFHELSPVRTVGSSVQLGRFALGIAEDVARCKMRTKGLYPSFLDEPEWVEKLSRVPSVLEIDE